MRLITRMPRRVRTRTVHCRRCGDPMLVVTPSYPDQERLCNPCILGWKPWNSWREQD